jgi:hypothetical protein
MFIVNIQIFSIKEPWHRLLCRPSTSHIRRTCMVLIRLNRTVSGKLEHNLAIWLLISTTACFPRFVIPGVFSGQRLGPGRCPLGVSQNSEVPCENTPSHVQRSTTTSAPIGKSCSYLHVKPKSLYHRHMRLSILLGTLRNWDLWLAHLRSSHLHLEA